MIAHRNGDAPNGTLAPNNRNDEAEAAERRAFLRRQAGGPFLAQVRVRDDLTGGWQWRTLDSGPQQPRGWRTAEAAWLQADTQGPADCPRRVVHWRDGRYVPVPREAALADDPQRCSA